MFDNIKYWMDVGVDGFRFDAVTSMVELDFGRKEGEWTKADDGSNKNYPAIHFLQLP